MQIRKKILAGVLALVMALSFVLTVAQTPARAASSIGTGTTTTGVNLRSGPGESYKKIGSLASGTKITLYQKSGMWYKTKVSGKDAWVAGTRLKISTAKETKTPDQSSTQQNGSVLGTGVTTRTGILRKGAGTSYAQTGTVKAGTKLTLTAKSGSWYKVRVSGKDHWIFGGAMDITLTKATPTVKTETQPVVGSAVVTDKAAFRKAADIKSASMSMVAVGTKIPIYGSSGGWYKTKIGGKTGYISSYKVDVTFTRGESESGAIGTAKTIKQAAFRKGAGGKHESMGSIAAGTQLTLLAKSGTWYKTKIAGKVGYVAASTLKVTLKEKEETAGKEDKPAGKTIGTAVCTAKTQMNLRSGAGTNYAKSGTLKGGAKVDLYAQKGDWYQIKADGSQWAYGGYLKITLAKEEKEAEQLAVSANVAIGSVLCMAQEFMNLRSGPGTGYDKEGIMLAKERADVYEIKNGWYRLLYKKKMVWASGDWLSYTSLDGKTVEAKYGTGTEAAPSKFTLYYQGDSAWGFSAELKKKACAITSWAILLKNMGINATPKTVYKANGGTGPNAEKLGDAFGVKAVNPLAGQSYLASFENGRMTISSPGKNGEAAIKLALKKNPEGVVVNFKNGSKEHSVVACKVSGGKIYCSDPGRNKGRLLTLEETWVNYHHKMTYAHIQSIIALDKR